MADTVSGVVHLMDTRAYPCGSGGPSHADVVATSNLDSSETDSIAAKSNNTHAQ